MDKKILTKEMIDTGKSFAELGFTAVNFLPYNQCEECAFEMAARLIIVDPDGVVYYNYNQEMIESFFKLKYFTDVDTGDWETDEGMYVLYDFWRKTIAEDQDLGSQCYKAGFGEVLDIVMNLYDAMNRKHSLTSSLPYKIGKAFGSILDNEDIVEKIVQSREVSEKMIDMIKVFKKNEEESKKGAIPMAMFARK